METIIAVGNTICGSDGALGQIQRIIVNPNTNRLEYLAVQALRGDLSKHYIPRSRMELGADGMVLTIDASEVASLPVVEETTAVQGSLQSNLHDLCVIDQSTAVKTESGESLGSVHGLGINADYEVVSIVTNNNPEQSIPIARIARYSEETLMIEPAERSVAR